MSSDDLPASDWPSEVALHARARTLELAWDGRRATLTHRALRRSCRCSVCEHTRRDTGAVLAVPDDVALVAIEPLGATAVQLVFSDGHQRGIYPWIYLKQMAFGPAPDGFPDTLTKGWRDE